MTDNCEHCGLAYKPGLHLEIGCLARQVVNLRADLAAVMEEKATVWKQLHEARAKLALAREALEHISGNRGNLQECCRAAFHRDDLDNHDSDIASSALEKLGSGKTSEPMPDTPPFDESAIWERCADYAEEHWKESGGYIAVQMRERAKKIRALAEKARDSATHTNRKT